MNAEEPVEYGYDRHGAYTPSPDEIQAACAEIRTTWTTAEERRRRCYKRKPVETPIIEDQTTET